MSVRTWEVFLLSLRDCEIEEYGEQGNGYMQAAV